MKLTLETAHLEALNEGVCFGPAELQAAISNQHTDGRSHNSDHIPGLFRRRFGRHESSPTLSSRIYKAHFVKGNSNRRFMVGRTAQDTPDSLSKKLEP